MQVDAYLQNAFRIQPKSLLTTCMKVLRQNYTRVNMTILPIELAERLNTYIMSSNDSPAGIYFDCIITTHGYLYEVFNKFAPIRANPNHNYIYEHGDYRLRSKLKINNYNSMLKFNTMHSILCNNMCKIYTCIDTYIIKIKNISPVILEYLLTNAKACFLPNVSKCIMNKKPNACFTYNYEN